MHANALPNRLDRREVFDDSISRDYRAIISDLAKHEVKVCALLLGCASPCSRNIFTIIGKASDGVLGFLLPCSGIFYIGGEVGVEGQRILYVLSPSFERCYGFGFSQ